MFRVLFRLIKICIHIKQTLQLEIVFKKGNQMIASKELYPLIDGIAHINTTTEFLITKQDPTFELHINFTFKKTKKQAGFIQLNLRDWAQGGSFQEIRKLENAPGGKALIQFGFIYFDSGVDPLPKSLESFQVFERDMNQEYRSQMQEQNKMLGQKLKELMSLKETLADQKECYNKIQANFMKAQSYFEEEVVSQSKRMNKAKSSLEEQQEKSHFLMELMKNSGSQDLLKYVKGLDTDEMSMQSEDNEAFSH